MTDRPKTTKILEYVYKVKIRCKPDQADPDGYEKALSEVGATEFVTARVVRVPVKS